MTKGRELGDGSLYILFAFVHSFCPLRVLFLLLKVLVVLSGALRGAHEHEWLLNLLCHGGPRRKGTP